MTVNPIIPSKGSPSQVSGTQNQDGEQAFNNMTKSEGYNKGALEQAVTERTRLTRNKRVDRTKKKHSSLFLVSDDDELFEEAVYRTVMVDGILFTLRLLAVA
ncbi:MAG: hypothetical protein HYY52_01130 [Candidatus Melainabacteria bacterium]|nr:hypothetical protein [Candidatus Melainabacteria bacterium]